MLNKLIDNIYFFFKYDHAKLHYKQISNQAYKEKVYYKKNQLFIAVKDHEIGRRLYDVLSIIQERDVIINSRWLILSLKKFGYNRQNIVKYVCFNAELAGEWENYTKIQKLEVVISFVEKMQTYGLYLDWSKFENLEIDCFSEFLSYFVNCVGDSEIPKDYRLEYVFSVLSAGDDLKEFYKKITEKNTICKYSDMLYPLPIVKMFYTYYKTGKTPSTISESLVEFYWPYLDRDKLILLDDEFLDSQYTLVDKNNEFAVYEDSNTKIKIYYNMSQRHRNFLSKKELISKYESKTVEQLNQIIINLDGDIIGYTYSYNDIGELHKVLDKKLNSQKEIIDFVSKIIEFFSSFNYYYDGLDNHNFNIEESFMYLQMNSYYDSLKVKTIMDLINLICSDENNLKEKITLVFFKLLQNYINSNGVLDREEQFWEKEEIRLLNPVVAREFINFALNKEVNYKSSANALWYFMENREVLSFRNIYYDSRFEFISSSKSKNFFFEDEIKKKYNFQNGFQKGENITLPDGRRLVIFKSAKKNLKLLNKVARLKDYIRENLGQIQDSHVKIINISEIVYSRKLNSEYMYKVIGYVTEVIPPIEQLTQEYLLNLNNKDLLKVVDHFLIKFNKYYIPWENIFVDKDFNFYIDIFNKEFKIKRTNCTSTVEYIQSVFNDLILAGYNPNAFIDFNFNMQDIWYGGWYLGYFGKLSDSMDSYCDVHKIFYDSHKDSHKNLCPVCAKTIFLVEENLSNTIIEDSLAKHYYVDGGNYGLKIYKDSVKDLKKIEENVDLLIGKKIAGISNDHTYQDCFIPCKKAIDKDKKFIGYVYEAEKFADEGDNTDICIDIKNYQKLQNLPRLKSLIRLLLQVKDITESEIGFSENPFSYVFLNSSHKKQVQILNVELLTPGVNVEKTKKWACKYVCQVISADDSIEVDTTEYSNDFEKLLSTLQDVAKHMTRFCTIHKMYYTDNYAFCPRCVGKELLQNIKIVRENKSKYDSIKPNYKGGEAFIYSYDEEEKVVKIFKEDVMINYELKVLTLLRILSKKDILDTINAENHKYKYISPENLMLDEESNRVIGYIMTKVEDAQPISNLRDKEIIKELGFTLEDVLEILITTGEGIETLHERLNIFIGDLNGRNILFDKEKNVYFLDCDGMGIDEFKPEFFTDGYIDPVSKKNRDISKKDDWYSFAIQAFYYLTYTHPFNGVYYEEIDGKKVSLDIPDKMERRLSLLGNHGIKVPTIANPWNWMTDKLQLAFLDIFEGDSRISIVPYLKKQYEKVKTLFSKELKPLNKIFRINSKFIARELENPFGSDITKVLNPSVAINEDKLILYVLLEEDNKEVIKLSNSLYRFKDAWLSSDKNYAFLVYTGGIKAYNLRRDYDYYTIDLHDKISIISEDKSSIYFIKEDDESCMYKFSFWFDEEKRINVDKETIELGKHNFKWFKVANGKFVLIERTADGLDRVYCNSEKFCDIQYNSSNSIYHISYDKLTNSWLVINTEGNGIIIKPSGKYTEIHISDIINDENINNIRFVKGKIYIPCTDYLYIVNGQITKKLECHEIMTPNSILYDINTEGFSVITNNVFYEVRRG